MVTKIYKVGSEWCGPCRLLKQELKDFNLVPIIEIDADEDEIFCEKYNIKNKLTPATIICKHKYSKSLIGIPMYKSIIFIIQVTTI